MIYFVRAEDQEEVADLVPLIQEYAKVATNEDPRAILLIMKIVAEVDLGVVIKAMDKGRPIGYVMGAIGKDITGNRLNVLGIYADRIGTGKELLEKIEDWARDEHDVHFLRCITRQNPEAMSRLFGTTLTGYVLEKELG